MKRTDPHEARLATDGPADEAAAWRSTSMSGDCWPDAPGPARGPARTSWVVACRRRRGSPVGYEQPLVLPQLGQAWQEPARCIWTPHCMQ